MGSLPTVITGGYPDPGAAVLPAGIISAAICVVCVPFGNYTDSLLT